MTVTWERNVSEVVWESQTAPGITWTTVVGGTVTGGESVLERTTTNDGENVLLASVNGVDGTDGVVVIGPRGYRLDAEGGPGFLPLTVDPRSGAGVQAPLNTLSTGPAGPLRKTGSAATAWSEIASGGTTVRRADAVALLMTSSPSGLSVTVSYGEDYGSFTATVANSATVIALNIADGGELQLWTAHSGAWTAGSTAGWAVGDRVQVLEADGDGFGGVLGDSPFGPGLLIPVWDNAKLIDERAQAIADATVEPVADDLAELQTSVETDLASLERAALFARQALPGPVLPVKVITGNGHPDGAWVLSHLLPQPTTGWDLRARGWVGPRGNSPFAELLTRPYVVDRLPGGDDEADNPEFFHGYDDVGITPGAITNRVLTCYETTAVGANDEAPGANRNIDNGARIGWYFAERVTHDFSTGVVEFWVEVTEDWDWVDPDDDTRWRLTDSGTYPTSDSVENTAADAWCTLINSLHKMTSVEIRMDGELEASLHAEDGEVGATSIADRISGTWATDEGAVEWHGYHVETAGFQPVDADLTTIAALAPADGRFMRRLAGVWGTSTPSEVKSDLSIGHADVSGFDEQARDVLGAALTAGAGITITLNDGANTITVAMADAATVLAALGVGWRKVDLQSAASAASSLSASLGVAGALKYRIHWRARSTANAVSATVGLRINSSSASDYTMAGSALATSGYFGLMAGSQTNSDRWGAGVLEITPGPAAVNAWSLLQGLESRVNSTATITSTNSPIHGAWRDSVGAGMSTIQMIPSAGNLDAGSYMYVEVLL